MKYVGIDYHKELATVCIMSGAGNVQEVFEVPATPAGMDEFVSHMGKGRFKVMGEAFSMSIDLHNHLIGRGIDSILIKPTDLRLITQSSKKTDPNDAVNIARYLMLHDKGQLILNPSFILKDGLLKSRCICRLREDMAIQKGKLSQNIKSHMRVNAEYLPKEVGEDLNTQKVRNAIMIAYADDPTLMEMMNQYTYIETRCKALESSMKDMEFDWDSVELLKTIPGVGELTACQIMSMIVDISRFESADKMRSFFGMAPNVRDSGGKMNHSHITKKGDSMMRHVLMRTVVLHNQSCPLSPVSRCYRSRNPNGKKSAQMAAANKLLTIIYAMLRDRRPFLVLP